MTRGGIRDSGGTAEISSHPFRSLFDLMLVLAFLFAGAFTLARGGGKEKIDASPLKAELLTLHSVDARRRVGRDAKPITNLTALPNNDPCQVLQNDAAHITMTQRNSLEKHRADLWQANLETIQQKLRADTIERVVSQKDLTFASGSASPINPDQGQSLLNDAYKRYREGYKHIRIEGHTDNIAIRTAQFPSNWELSAARAIWLATKMEQDLARRNIRVGQDVQIEAVGYGDKRPLAPNTTPQGRDRNRRIEIRFER